MRSNKISVLIIVFAGLAAGSVALKGAWHFDDFYTIVRNDALRDPSNLIKSLYDPGFFSADPSRPMYRPVLVASYILNFLALGDSVSGFLAINLLLHVLNALLVWGIASNLLSDGKDRWSGWGALAAGLIYAVHPAATEGIAYASARSAVLATSLMIGALLVYMRWARRGSAAALAGSAILFVMGLGAKSIAVILPAIVILYHIGFKPGGGANWKRGAAGVGAISVLAIGYVYLRRVVMGVVLAESLVRPISENLLTQSRSYIHYFRLFLWPIHQSINPYFPAYSSIFNPQVYLSIAAIAALSVVGVYLLFNGGRSGRAAGLGILWIMIALLPESSIVPLNLVVSERRMILPLAGFAIFAGAMIQSVRASWRYYMTGTICVCLACLTVARLHEWRSEESLWRSAVRVDPGWGLLWNNLGLIYMERSDVLRAKMMFELAAANDANFAEARLNLGHIYARGGRFDLAEQYYRQALDIKPGYANAAVMLAQTLDREGMREEARAVLTRFILLYRASRPYYLLGVFDQKDGHLDEAAADYRTAIDLNPYDPLPTIALAELLYAKGDVQGAVECLSRFLNIYRTEDNSRQEALKLLDRISNPH